MLVLFFSPGCREADGGGPAAGVDASAAPSLVEPEAAAAVEGGYVVYPGAHQRGDVLHRATAEGTDDLVWLGGAPAADEQAYQVRLGERVAGLRLVGQVLEFVDGEGTPRLRMAPPW